MQRFCLILSLLLLTVLGLAACSSHPPDTIDTGARVIPHPGVEGLPGVPGQGTSAVRPVGYFSYTLPIIPITFTIGFNGSFSVDLSAGAATALGDFRISAGVAESTTNDSVLPTEAVGITRLVICENGTNNQVCQGYAIDTGRKVRVTLVGHFQETIDNSLVIIDASPGSTVTVSDAGEQVNVGAKPAARIDVEDFAFTVYGPYTNVALEQSQGGREDDLSYDHVTGVLQPINGAEVADIKHYAAADGNSLPTMNLPAEEDCAQIPSTAWRSTFTAADLRADITLACIFTAEKDFGYLVIGRDPGARPVSYYVYSYIWVR
jgi:hypothetical protein